MRVGALFALVAAVSGLLSGCNNFCANDIIQTLEAPGGEHKAVLFQRDCGATTAYSTQVSILDADEPLTGSGNTFVADDRHGAAGEATWGGPWVELTWRAPDRLLVRYDAKARVFEDDQRVSGVRISYQKVDRWSRFG